MKLAVVFGVLLLASIARADSVDGVFIPDGSTVTSINTNDTHFEPSFGPATYVSYSFADGIGYSVAGGGGAAGMISFTTPVSDLSFSYGLNDIEVLDNVGDVLSFAVAESGTCYPCTDTFSGSGISQITWNTAVTNGGITSLTYTLDSPPSVPEPSSLLLSGMGVAALIGLACRNRSKGQKVI